MDNMEISENIEVQTCGNKVGWTWWYVWKKRVEWM